MLIVGTQMEANLNMFSKPHSTGSEEDDHENLVLKIVKNSPKGG